MVVTYFLPMLSMSVTYAKIGVELWGARAIGEATEVQRDSINSKRRVSTKRKALRLEKSPRNLCKTAKCTRDGQWLSWRASDRG